MNPFPNDPDYADHRETIWQRDADLADAAAAEGLTPEEFLELREADRADRVRDGQNDRNDAEPLISLDDSQK
jgi:hypothetical protein